MVKCLVILMIWCTPSFSMESKPTAIAIPEEEQLYDTVVTTYFRKQEIYHARVQPYIRAAIKQASDSPVQERIPAIVANVSHRALADQEREINRRWTKRQSACCAAVTGVLTTVISAGVTLAIALSGKKC